MINIKILATKISIEGHANCSKSGNDIVCAAVSAISMGSIGWFNRKDVEIVMDEKKPSYSIELINKSKENKLLIKLIGKQLKSIAQSNKKYICLK